MLPILSHVPMRRINYCFKGKIGQSSLLGHIYNEMISDNMETISYISRRRMKNYTSYFGFKSIDIQWSLYTITILYE